MAHLLISNLLNPRGPVFRAVLFGAALCLFLSCSLHGTVPSTTDKGQIGGG